jgi:hypothetical protein
MIYPPELIAKVRRVYAAALVEIASAYRIGPADVLTIVDYSEPAPTTEQKNGGEPMLGAEPAAVTPPITEPEQMPVIERSSHDVATEKSRVERSRLVTLRDKESGLYLNLDGTGTTVDVSNAYRGTERQAATMRQRSEHAKGMNIYTFTQRTK